MRSAISLKTLLIGLLGLVFLLLGLALFLAGLAGTRDFLQRQLASHAQDTASTLALQLTDELSRADMGAVTSSVDALFDSGYYRRITLSQPDGRILLDRELPIRVEGAPDWFVRAVPLATPSGRAESMSSWKRTVIQVSSHPGFAYRQLWTTTRDTLGLALVFWGIAAVLGAILLARALRPLGDMEQLALGVARGEFSHLRELPRVRELRHIGQSLNLMSDSVSRMLAEKSSLVEKLQVELYHDPHTGLANRAFFMATLVDVLREHADTCALVLLQVDGLGNCNSRQGRAAGDQLIRAVAAAVRAAEHLPAEHVARIDGSQFGVILEFADTEKLRAFADALARAAALAVQDLDREQCCSVHVGAALAEGADSATLLARADAALRDAKLGPTGTSRVAAGATPGASGLREILRQAVVDAKLRIEWQPVLTCGDEDLDHFEAYARLQTPDGNTLPAGAFVYLAEESGLVTTLDKLILSDAWVAERLHPSAACSVNLSTVSLLDGAFVSWLTGFVQTPRQLYLELPTNRLATSPDARHNLLSLREAGFRIVLDRFIPQANALTWLHDIRPDWVKVEGSLCRQAKDDVGTRAMLKTLCAYARELGCKVGATGVEYEDDLKVLCELGFHAAQGRLFNHHQHAPPPGPAVVG
jgi:diguanylate cyclase (GGDEF)-like protein